MTTGVMFPLTDFYYANLYDCLRIRIRK